MQVGYQHLDIFGIYCDTITIEKAENKNHRR